MRRALVGLAGVALVLAGCAAVEEPAPLTSDEPTASASGSPSPSEAGPPPENSPSETGPPEASPSETGPPPPAWPPTTADSWRSLPATFFALHDNDWTSYPPAPIGAANLTTSGTYWFQVETTPGGHDFTRLDQQVAAVERGGARPMLVLGGTPEFHGVGGTTDGVARTARPMREAWRAYVAAVARRYGARLDYQIWPEPNIVQNWAGTPEEMAELTALAAREVRRVAPRATVVSPAVALRLPSQQGWFRRYLAARPLGRPTAHWFDVAAIDPFPVTDGTPEDSVRLVEAARRALDAAGSDAPVWTNEINYGVLGGGATTPVSYPDAQSAAYVARTYLLHAGAGVERVYWLGWFEAPGMAIEMADAAGRASPAGRALGTIRGWLSAGEFGGCSRGGGVHHCLVRRGDAIDVIAWTERGSKRLPVPPGLSATTLDGRTLPQWRGLVGTSPVRVTGP